MAKGYMLAGDLFAKIGLEHEAIKFYNKALVEYEKNKDSTEYVYIYLGLGSTYAIIANYEEANKNFKQALSCTKASDHSGTSPIEINIELGRLEYKFKNFSAAADYHKLALELSLQIGFPGGEAISSHELAKDLFQLKKYAEAKKHAERSLEIKKKITSVEQIMRTEKICFRIDSAIGNYKEALIHYMAFMTLQNKLNTEEIHRSSIKEDLNHKFEEEKEKEKLVQQKKEAEAASELKQQKFIRNSLFIGFLLLGLVALIILRNYFAKKKLSAELANKNHEISHQKHLIEEKQKEVLDSIRYAKRIQTSLLPTEKYIERIFKDKK
ncbi:MAG: tetratricopeptide repeat protein [Sphingobacteriaceae bacterium]|nr:tetratricopeptide repeat protein [Sphingobacteriaceae bacterium]